jgi:hypothetical protein
MGIESFGVVLRAKRTLPIKEIRSAVLSFPNVHFVKDDNSGSSFEYNDGEHLVELLLRGSDKDAEFDLCVRFALCNPDGVEGKFTRLIAWAASRWRPAIWQLSSATKQKTQFSPDESDVFLANVREEVRALGQVWQKAFGIKRGLVRVEDVFGWLGVPPS